MNPIRRLLLRFAPLLLCASAFAQGRIVVSWDDWTLTDNAYTAAPTTDQLVRNLGDWFTGGSPGNFRAWSDSFAIKGAKLALTFASEGHTWTVSTAGTFDLATLQNYDAIFVGVYTSGIDTNVLAQYVQSGGCLYVFGGSSGSVAATAWNPLLNGFGLSFSSVITTLSGVVPVSSSHPLLTGVTGLYNANGNSVSLSASPPFGANVLATSGSTGLLAVYDSCPSPTIYCTAKVNSQGCVPAISVSGTAHPSGGSPFLIQATKVINKSVGVLIYGYQSAATPFQGGTLCIGGAIKRTPGQATGGNPTGTDCTGSLSMDFNAYIAQGIDPLLSVVGQEVDAQYWSRDVLASFGSSLTNAVQFGICP